MSAHDTPLSPVARFIFGFVAINALLGAGSLMLFPSRTGDLFFWTISPPINAALFGALYLGGAVVVGWVTYRGVWEPARFLIPVLVSAGILITLTTFVHQDKFTAGIKLFYWLLIYIGAPLLAFGIYVHQERQGANWAIVEPLAPLTRRLAAITGAIVLIFGALIWITPTTFQAEWAWAVSPLMLRIFASWFGAFGVGLLWFLVDGDWQRLRHIASLMIAAAALDLAMVAIHWDDVKPDQAAVWLYCFHLVAFGIVGALMHWLQRQHTGNL